MSRQNLTVPGCCPESTRAMWFALYPVCLASQTIERPSFRRMSLMLCFLGVLTALMSPCITPRRRDCQGGGEIERAILASPLREEHKTAALVSIRAFFTDLDSGRKPS